MNIAGGNGYRWRGKFIRTVTKNYSTCVTLPRKESVVMIPANVYAERVYKISIMASKNSGNGAILVNFFADKNFDGKHVSAFISSNELREYSVSVPVPKFPTNYPMYLRIWRPNDAQGNVFIQSVRYVADKAVVIPETNTPLEAPKVVKETAPITTPKLDLPQRRNHKPRIKRKVPRHKPEDKFQVPVINKIKENQDMKFRPYKSRSTDMADRVLIRSAEDVPKISIITPTRDGLNNIKKCFEAVNKNTAYPNWEWIIGDSCSTDGTAEFIKNLKDPRIKLVERNTIEGSFSSINNELVEYSDGEYLLFLNDDTEPQQFWMYEMISKMHRHPEIGIVGSKLLYSEDRIQHAGIAFIPQGPANLGKAVLSSFPKGFANQDRFLQAVTGACLLIRKDDFKEVGGFDPIYYFCYEDVDLCLKVREKLNKKVLYSSKSHVFHAESVTQKKHKTAGEKQQIGIKEFKKRWMNKVSIDFPTFQKSESKGVYPTEISFVTCVNNISQYRNYIVGSLFKSKTKKNYEVIPILNFNNPYSAAQALNMGIEKAKADIVVLCHQDVLFYEDWVDMLFDRIKEIESVTKKWGVLGTAGITQKDDTIGVVHSVKGKIQWQSTKRTKVYPVQTVDEHCMIIRKSSGLRFDAANFNGFHFYGPDICLTALDKGLKNYGILCPLVHDSASGSLVSGQNEFMRLLHSLSRKWKAKFNYIRTPTSMVKRGVVRTFVRFKYK